MNTLTLSEIAKRLDISPSTLRYWAGLYADYLKPEQPKTGRYKLYGEEDVEVLEAIKKHAQEGQQAPQIRTLLADQFGEVVNVQQQQRNGGTTTNQQQQLPQGSQLATTNAQQMSSLMEWQKYQQTITSSYQRQNAELAQRIAELEEEIATKTAEIATLKQNQPKQRRGILEWISGND